MSNEGLKLLEEAAIELDGHSNNAYCEMGVQGDILDRVRKYLAAPRPEAERIYRCELCNARLVDPAPSGPHDR